jgi:hypothetical protein
MSYLAMDWDDIYERAKRFIPQQDLKERRCWIGVLDHRKSIQDEFKEADFIWMIGHSVSSTGLSCVAQRWFGDIFARELCREGVEAYATRTYPRTC